MLLDEFKAIVTAKLGATIVASGEFTTVADNGSYMFDAQNNGLSLSYNKTSQRWVSAFNNATGGGYTIDRACDVMAKKVNRLYEVNNWR